MTKKTTEKLPPNITRLTSGMYRYRVQVGRQRRTGTAASVREAKAEMAKIKAAMLEGRVVPRVKRTLADWLAQYAEEQRAAYSPVSGKGWTPKTFGNYMYLARRIGLLPKVASQEQEDQNEERAPSKSSRLKNTQKKTKEPAAPPKLASVQTILGALPLQAVTAEHLVDLYARMTELGCSYSAQHQIHALLSGAFKLAVARGLVIRNPADTAHPSRAVAPREQPAWSPEEVARFIKVAARSRWGLPLLLILMTGLRRGEATALRWADLNVKHGRLQVRLNRVVVNGQIVEGPPKSRRSRRSLKLGPGTLALLARLRDTQALERQVLGDRWHPTNYVVTQINGNPMHPDGLKRYLDALSKEAGVPHQTVHGLRRTFATLLLQKGVPLEVVSRILGHHKPSFTSDVYRHVSQDEQDEYTFDLTQLIEPRAGETTEPPAELFDDDDEDADTE